MAKGVPKGTKRGPRKPPVGFVEYRKKEAATVSATRVEKSFKFEDKDYEAGDYLVQDPDLGTLVAMSASEFETAFERVIRHTKPKEVSTAGETTDAPVAEAAPAVENAVA